MLTDLECIIVLPGQKVASGEAHEPGGFPKCKSPQPIRSDERPCRLGKTRGVWRNSREKPWMRMIMIDGNDDVRASRV